MSWWNPGMDRHQLLYYKSTEIADNTESMASDKQTRRPDIDINVFTPTSGTSIYTDFLAEVEELAALSAGCHLDGQAEVKSAQLDPRY